jgi:enediyne biosynthesis thioesterase
MDTYDLRHIVTFSETNLIGNVYYAEPVRWQGRCRELFLFENAREVLDELSRELRMVTVRCSCDYIREMFTFDEILIKMRLADVIQNRIVLGFEYWRISKDPHELVATGEHEVACMRRDGEQVVSTPIPAALRKALRPYAEESARIALGQV